MRNDQSGQLDPLRISIRAAGGKLIEGAMCYVQGLMCDVTVSNLGMRSCQTQDRRSDRTPDVSAVRPESEVIQPLPLACMMCLWTIVI